MVRNSRVARVAALHAAGSCGGLLANSVQRFVSVNKNAPANEIDDSKVLE